MDVDVAHYLPDKLFLCRIIHHLSSFFFKNHLQKDFLYLGELVTRGMTNPRENSSEALAQNFGRHRRWRRLFPQSSKATTPTRMLGLADCLKKQGVANAHLIY